MRSPCILISDSQLANRRMLGFAMNLKGYEVLECADVDGVMAPLNEHRVDLLLVSLYPREGEGYTLLEKLRQCFTRATLPVLLIGDTILRAEFDHNAWRDTAWLDRPFQISELMNLVESILSLSPSNPGQRS